MNSAVLARRLRNRGIPDLLGGLDHRLLQSAKSVGGSERPGCGNHSSTTSRTASRIPTTADLLLFNAGPSSSKINRNKDAIAFVDDYTSWVTEPSAEENTWLLQEKGAESGNKS